MAPENNEQDNIKVIYEEGLWKNAKIEATWKKTRIKYKVEMSTEL